MTFLLLGSLWACIERKIMPEKLQDPLFFDVDISADIRTEQHQYQVAHDLKISIEPTATNRDDSLLLEIRFLEAKWAPSKEDSVWQPSSLEGHSFWVTVFPWGELLQIKGWEDLPEAPQHQGLDILLPLLFPNPPERPSQQWNYRVLPWRYRGSLPEDYVRVNQKVIANWAKTSEMVWSYEGTWEAKTRLDDLFVGEVSGDVEKSGVWIDRHTWNWKRDILFPTAEHHLFEGQVRRADVP